MTLDEIREMGMKPIKTVLHPPKDGVWGHTIFKRTCIKSPESNFRYVAQINRCEGQLIYGQPIKIPLTQYRAIMARVK